MLRLDSQALQGNRAFGQAPLPSYRVWQAAGQAQNSSMRRHRRPRAANCTCARHKKADVTRGHPAEGCHSLVLSHYLPLWLVIKALAFTAAMRQRLDAPGCRFRALNLPAAPVSTPDSRSFVLRPRVERTGGEHLGKVFCRQTETLPLTGPRKATICSRSGSKRTVKRQILTVCADTHTFACADFRCNVL